MKDYDLYIQRAAEARADADAAVLDNVRDRCLRAEAAWKAMADRAAMAPMDRCTEADHAEVTGAVLLAPGVAHTVGARTVLVGADPDRTPAGLVIDPGAAAFDPGATTGVPDAAGRLHVQSSAAGRRTTAPAIRGE